jgi:hypothetical protein
MKQESRNHKIEKFYEVYCGSRFGTGIACPSLLTTMYVTIK